MELGGLNGERLSPESTVTSLLSSSGHLRSSLRPPDYDTTFRYRDTDYDSASEALDAYIADFERSRQKCGSLTGSLTLPTPHRPFASVLRNKDVLRERLTERELDFLHLPVSSLLHRSNQDRMSMTTEELLAIPNDGSEPVTHTSAYIQALFSRSGASQSQPIPSSSNRSEQRAFTGLNNSYTKSYHPKQRHQLFSSPLRSSRSRGRSGVTKGQTGTDVFKSNHRAVTSHGPETSLSLHLHPCDFSEPHLPTECFLHPGALRTGAPSWVAELEEAEEDTELTASQESQLTLRDLRLQFAEQISQLAVERQGGDIMANLSRDNKIESLIQKADKVLSTLSQGSAGEPLDSVRPESSDALSPVHTEDLLHYSHLCSPPLTVGSTVGKLTEAHTHRLEEPVGGSADGSSWKQPGPVEAFKQMLFRLQAVETQLQQQQHPPPAPAPSDGLQTPVKQRPDETQVHSCPASPSLQRALYHLSRLKLLVQESGEKEEEKDEDEGRYSASPADRPDSSQQEPS
ncbi:lung adenoma susceptibility protein 2 [Gouania willdenowi]|uniref:Lung adenoma susceptibility protein 2 n=1 Tax=Gouania willdenowi TaxID=441366 RepID=A0A8C5DM06_GOUWI|nr:lung adenoma susceptibility protein 2 [Gouania willdenowi]